jgi:sarcosine oxidase subunit gamma
VTGTKIPAQRGSRFNGDRACGWMSPDEYLLVLPYAEVGATVAALSKALAGEHFLAVDVSDARAMFRITGAKADRGSDAKLARSICDIWLEGELRRTPRGAGGSGALESDQTVSRWSASGRSRPM